MLNGDEHAWNEQLAKRINQYRKRPSDYQPVVDFVSISLIKMAQKLNLQYQFKVEEIPEYFFESIHIIERMDCKIIDLKKCEVAFQKWENKRQHWKKFVGIVLMYILNHKYLCVIQQ